MKHSLLQSKLSLPHGVQIQTHCRDSPVLDSSPRAICQSLSISPPLINHSASLCHLSTLLSSHFSPEASSQGMQTLTVYSRAWHSSRLPVLNNQTSNYHRSNRQKTLCIQPASPHHFLCLLPAKFFRACDKPTVVSSLFWLMGSHKKRAPTASITHRNKTKTLFKKNLVCKHQGKENCIEDASQVPHTGILFAATIPVF